MNLREEQSAMRARQQQQRSIKKTAEKINRLSAQIAQAEQRLADKLRTFGTKATYRQ